MKKIKMGNNGGEKQYTINLDWKINLKIKNNKNKDQIKNNNT
jgi:hypothetical protein